MADGLAKGLQLIVLDEQSRYPGMYTYSTLYKQRFNMSTSRFYHNAKNYLYVYFNEFQ